MKRKLYIEKRIYGKKWKNTCLLVSELIISEHTCALQKNKIKKIAKIGNQNEIRWNLYMRVKNKRPSERRKWQWMEEETCRQNR